MDYGLQPDDYSESQGEDPFGIDRKSDRNPAEELCLAPRSAAKLHENTSRWTGNISYLTRFCNFYLLIPLRKAPWTS